MTPLDKLGEYIVKADCNGNIDTIKIIVYRMEFESVPGHKSSEGKISPSGAIHQQPAPEEYWDINRKLNGGARLTSYVGNSINLYAEGKTFAANYKAAEGTNKYLQLSTENKYNAFLNVGDASISVKVTIDWTASGSLAPVGTGVIETGSVHAYVKKSISEVNASWSRYIVPSGTPPVPTLQDPVAQDPNPVVYSGAASGKHPLGYVQVAIGYTDSGANLGLGTVTVQALYSVEKGP